MLILAMQRCFSSYERINCVFYPLSYLQKLIALRCLERANLSQTSVLSPNAPPWASSHSYQSVVSFCPEDWMYNRYWRRATSQFPGVEISRKDLWQKVLTAVSGRGNEEAMPADQVLLLQRASLGRTTCSHKQKWLWGEGKETSTDALLRKDYEGKTKPPEGGAVTICHP